jgi:hypothetical protein
MININDRIDSNDLGIDDVVLNASHLRIERLDDNTFWIAAYNGNVRTTFTIGNSNCKITATLVEDHEEIQKF